MKFTLFEFDKSRESLENFSDLLQKAINDNNDLISVKTFENLYRDTVAVEFVFGSTKTKTTEFIAFGILRSEEVTAQINAVLNTAEEQGKEILFAGVNLYAKSNRAVGFLALQKVKEQVDGTSQHEEASQTIQASKQNKEADVKADARTKHNRRSQH